MATAVKKNRKIFVLDTNVLLHDYKSIHNFDEHDIVVPITVLEELDRFKKGNDIINFHAREFTRELDKLSGDKLFNGGLSLGRGKGKLSICTGKQASAELSTSFPENTPDHRILAIAEYLHLKNGDSRPVILITKDINLRMKAKSLGIMAQDYHNDMVQNIDDIYENVKSSDVTDDMVISDMYESMEGVPVERFGLPKSPLAHQYFIFRNNSKSGLGHYDPFNKMMNRVEKTRTYGIDPRNAEQTFALDALLRPEVQLVALTGKAGTGKTLLALAAAIHQRKMYTQILLARPIVPLGNRDLGYLPGDVSEKIGPYMQPLFDNLSVIKQKFKIQSKEHSRIEEMQQTEKLIITPLAYIRGRSLSRV
ncbi:MAG: ribonuclease, partial [Bacteroidetes bacterium]